MNIIQSLVESLEGSGRLLLGMYLVVVFYITYPVLMEAYQDVYPVNSALYQCRELVEIHSKNPDAFPKNVFHDQSVCARGTFAPDDAKNDVLQKARDRFYIWLGGAAIFYILGIIFSFKDGTFFFPYYQPFLFLSAGAGLLTALFVRSPELLSTILVVGIEFMLLILFMALVLIGKWFNTEKKNDSDRTAPAKKTDSQAT